MAETTPNNDEQIEVSAVNENYYYDIRKEVINLNKGVNSNKDAKKYLDRKFNELIDVVQEVDVKELFQIYNDLF